MKTPISPVASSQSVERVVETPERQLDPAPPVPAKDRVTVSKAARDLTLEAEGKITAGVSPTEVSERNRAVAAYEGAAKAIADAAR